MKVLVTAALIEKALNWTPERSDLRKIVIDAWTALA